MQPDAHSHHPHSHLEISWTQVETGSAITWKYPSCILRGDDSRGTWPVRSSWHRSMNPAGHAMGER
ncbi:MAG TPA: hypothetical protein EYP49_06800, partial [Anaerolineae bacterium]|nr:hypothetical protein [Anaerolineae bacterium]